jgi:hypothetical protein
LSGLRFSASLKPLATPDLERIPREASPKAVSDGEDFILYAILDFIVDNYMPVFPSGKLPRSARPPRRAGLLVSDAGAARLDHEWLPPSPSRELLGRAFPPPASMLA